MLEIICLISTASFFAVPCIVVAMIKKLETKLDRNMGFMKWVKARHDTTYISMLYSIQQYFVKQEMYEDAARMKKVIDEELKEINFSVGAEYNYNQQFFVRAGYFYENPDKGNRQYFAFGAGFSLNVVQLDASYMIATAQSSPLDQTLRFSLTFDMDGLKSLLGR